MPATTILSNNPVNSVFSNDNSHFTYRLISVLSYCFLQELTHNWNICFSNRRLK